MTGAWHGTHTPFPPFSRACRVLGNIYCLYNASHVALHTYRQLASRPDVAVQGTAAFRRGIRRQADAARVALFLTTNFVGQ
jgi:hypothetical protein